MCSAVAIANKTCNTCDVFLGFLFYFACSYHGTIAKHCVLIANRDPDDRPVQESDTYHKFTLGDLAEKFVEVSSEDNIHRPLPLA